MLVTTLAECTSLPWRAGWARAEVMGRVAVHGVQLPFQYGEKPPETLGRRLCPADLDPGRPRFLKLFYPPEHAERLRLASEVPDEAVAVLERERRARAVGAFSRVDARESNC